MTNDKAAGRGVFWAVTLGYGLFYVCRLSLNVLKKPIVDEGFLSESELGIIGSALFFSYAIGKFVNGFLGDRVNIRYFMSGALLLCALVNFLLGFKAPFWLFIVLWALNGWFQSAGAPCSAIALKRWFGNKNLGTMYGFWSAGHNLGEVLTFIILAYIVSLFNWQAGFFAAAAMGLGGAVFIFLLLKPYPAGQEPSLQGTERQKDVSRHQLTVLKTPMIWLLALASAFMYVARYAVNSWGIYYFEAEKAYSVLQASTLVSVHSICAIVGTVVSGYISDRFFHGKRNLMAVLVSAVNLASLTLFLFVPAGYYWLDIVSMVFFGLSIGILICFLGGLMAVDLAPAEAAGAAAGVIGIASYAAAGIQDILSGYFIEGNKTVVGTETVYDFSDIRLFWISAAVCSLALLVVIFLRVLKKSAKD